MMYVFVSFHCPQNATPEKREVETLFADTETQVRAVERNLDNQVRRMVAQPGIDVVEVYKLSHPDHRYVLELREVA